MNRRHSALHVVLVAAGAGIVASWLLDVVRSGFAVGPALLAGALLLLIGAGLAVVLVLERRRPSDDEEGV